MLCLRPRVSAALVLLVLGIGCKPFATERTPPESPQVLIVETHGCALVSTGPRCLLTESSTVVLWTDLASGQPEVRVHGEPRPTRWSPVQGGLQSHVRLAAADAHIEVIAERARWSMEIAALDTPTWVAEVEAAVGKGNIEEAEAHLAKIDDARPLAERAWAARWRGRIAWRASRPETGALRSVAAGLAEQDGLTSLAVDEHLAAGNAHLHIAGDVEGARAARERALELAEGLYARGVVLADELGAQIDLTLGDRRSAARTLERMAAGAHRLDAEDIRWAAVLLEAQNLNSMGRTERASKHLATIADLPITLEAPCREALVLNCRAWGRLVATELAGHEPPPNQRSDLDRALELHTTTCRDQGVALDDRLSLAFFEVQRGDASAAGRQLDAVQGEGGLRLPRIAAGYFDLAGRVALLEGRAAAAARLYARLAELASRTASADGAWRAEVGRARSLAASGDLEGAALAYQRAEQRLEARSLAIAIEDDRGMFLANHARYTRDLVALQLRMGRNHDAIDTIRRSRSRLLSHVDRDARLAYLSDAQRAQWGRVTSRIRTLRDDLDREVESAWGLSNQKLAESEARRAGLERRLERDLDEAVELTSQTAPPSRPSIKAGQVALGYHQAESGWVGFALTASVAQVEALGPIALNATPAELTARLLEPFAKTIGEASQIRVLASGGLEEVDFHALPWRGAHLVDHHEVVYALDLAPRTQRVSPAWALVVSDPVGNLPRARAEARAVRDALLTDGLQVRLLQHSEATAPAIRAALAEARHFHYAGHAAASDADGWHSALLLADGARLDTGGILALAHAPTTAFLSGCETGRTDDRTVLSLGLAQAFVLAGTKEVIASVRPVDDATTEAIARAVYASDLDALTPALRAAQRALSKSSPSADWAAFRVIVP